MHHDTHVVVQQSVKADVSVPRSLTTCLNYVATTREALLLYDKPKHRVIMPLSNGTPDADRSTWNADAKRCRRSRGRSALWGADEKLPDASVRRPPTAYIRTRTVTVQPQCQ